MGNTTSNQEQTYDIIDMTDTTQNETVITTPPPIQEKTKIYMVMHDNHPIFYVSTNDIQEVRDKMNTYADKIIKYNMEKHYNYSLYPETYEYGVRIMSSKQYFLINYDAPYSIIRCILVEEK